ncbi:MAG: hypothetical protein JWO48_2547 [Bryobacterales bacterium]|nr:hypothetical protein [Bryobacterales bacterium]
MKAGCDSCSQVWRRHGFAPPGPARPILKGLRQLGRKRASWLLVAIPSAALPANVGTGDIGCCCCRLCGLRSTRRSFLAFWRLRRVGTQHTVFERCAIEAANDRLHLFIGGCFDKSEALGFLCFVVSNHLDGIGDQIFCCQPLLDVIGGDPGREIAKKNGKTHSVDCDSVVVDLRHGRILCHLDSIRVDSRIANG